MRIKESIAEEPVAGKLHGGFCEVERVVSQDMRILRHKTENGDTELRRNLKLGNLVLYSTKLQGIKLKEYLPVGPMRAVFLGHAFVSRKKYAPGNKIL